MKLDVDALQARIQAIEVEARLEGVTLFGAGGFARAVSSALAGVGIRVHAYVVTTPGVAYLDGIPVVSLGKLDVELKQKPMWLGLFNRNRSSDFFNVANACQLSGIGRVRFPMDYFELIEARMGWRFWLTDRRNYIGRLHDFEAVRSNLSDDESRRQFDQTLRFRLGLAESMSPMPSADVQYLLPQVLQALRVRRDKVVFVDGGAYDGDTLVQVSAYLSIDRAFAFEPDATNFKKLVGVAREVGFQTTCIPCGLSDATETVEFADEAGEGSAIRVGGGSRIQCVSLDECLGTDEVDFLKLDVEGHELAALAGAQNILSRDYPVLAIAAYHRWDDLWRIPSFIKDRASDYRFTYRMHMFNTFDGVFYATRIGAA